VVQVLLLIIATRESIDSWLERLLGSSAMWGALLMIALEGLSGGLSYVSVFYRLGQEEDGEEANLNPIDLLARREFKIACLFFFWASPFSDEQDIPV
jgi:battenin